MPNNLIATLDNYKSDLIASAKDSPKDIFETAFEVAATLDGDDAAKALKDYSTMQVETGNWSKYDPKTLHSIYRDIAIPEISARRMLVNDANDTIKGGGNKEDIIQMQLETGAWNQRQADFYSSLIDKSVKAKEERAKDVAQVEEGLGANIPIVDELLQGGMLAALDLDKMRQQLSSLSSDPSQLPDEQPAPDYNSLLEEAIQQSADKSLVGKTLADTIQGGTRSVAKSLLYAPGGPAATIGMFSLGSMLEANEEANRIGLSGIDKAEYVSTVGAIESIVPALFSVAGVGGLESIGLGGAKALTRQTVSGLTKEIAKNLGGEMIEELLQTTAELSYKELQGVIGKLSGEDKKKAILDTILQTGFSMGAFSGKSIVDFGVNNKSFRDNVSNIQKNYGLDKVTAESILDKAESDHKNGRDFTESLNEGIIKNVLKTDVGAQEWAKANIEQASILIEKEIPSRKDMKELGLSDVFKNKTERKGFVESMQKEEVPVEIPTEEIKSEIVTRNKAVIERGKKVDESLRPIYAAFDSTTEANQVKFKNAIAKHLNEDMVKDADPAEIDNAVKEIRKEIGMDIDYSLPVKRRKNNLLRIAKKYGMPPMKGLTVQGVQNRIRDFWAGEIKDDVKTDVESKSRIDLFVRDEVAETTPEVNVVGQESVAELSVKVDEISEGIKAIKETGLKKYAAMKHEVNKLNAILPEDQKIELKGGIAKLQEEFDSKVKNIKAMDQESAAAIQFAKVEETLRQEEIKAEKAQRKEDRKKGEVIKQETPLADRVKKVGINRASYEAYGGDVQGIQELGDNRYRNIFKEGDAGVDIESYSADNLDVINVEPMETKTDAFIRQFEQEVGLSSKRKSDKELSVKIEELESAARGIVDEMSDPNIDDERAYELDLELREIDKEHDRITGRIPSGDAMAVVDTSDSFSVQQKNEQKIDLAEDAITSPEVLAEAEKMSGKGLIGKLKETVLSNKMVDGLLEIVSPRSRGENAKKAAIALDQYNAQAAQQNSVVNAKLRKYKKMFYKMPMSEIHDFIFRVETGQKQKTEKLQEVADVMREVMDWERSLVQEYGVLDKYIKDYFPHLFKKVDEARKTMNLIHAKKTLKPSGFLKQRKYATIKEAMESNKDLQLAFSNPVTMIQYRMNEMNKFIVGSQIKQFIKSSGFGQFVPHNIEKDYTRQGYRVIDDQSMNVYGDNSITIEEAYDKMLADQLLGVAKGMGINHERLATMSGAKWGESKVAGKQIYTRFAGPLSVLAHEIGHQIGNEYDLYNHMVKTGGHLTGRVHKEGTKRAGEPVKKDIADNRRTIKAEFKELSSLRFEGSEDVDEKFKKYTRKKAEKEAVILEAWLAAPDKMKKVAPNITKAWTAFLDSHEEISPLLNLDRSLVLGKSEQKFEVGNAPILVGKWAVPNEVADIVDNYLKPGLIGHKNKLIGGAAGMARRVSNAMIFASLSVNGFHAFNVSNDAISSAIQVGLNRAMRLDFKGALREWAQAPGAWITDVAKGRKIIEAMESGAIEDISDPKLKMIAEYIIRAGGQTRMTAFHRNNSAENLTETFRDIKEGSAGEVALGLAKTPVQAISAALETAAKPIMELQVPMLKAGVFARFAADIHDKATKLGWDDARIDRELGKAWDSVDNRFGQMVYDRLHWNKTVKESLMLSLRALGWTYGSIREAGGGAVDLVTALNRIGTGDDVITRRTAYLFSSLLSYAIQGTVIMFLKTGKFPWDDEDDDGNIDEIVKNFFFPKTGNKNKDGSSERLALPHYSKEWLAWLTQPGTTLKHKANPLWGTLGDVITNEDYFGVKIRNEDDNLVEQSADVAKHIMKNFIPFSAKNFIKRMENDDGTVAENLITSFLGISPAPAYISRTKAEKQILDIMNENMKTTKTRTSKDAEERKKRNQVIADLREGKEVDFEGFSANQITYMKNQAKVNVYQSRFKKLNFAQAVSVFNVSNKKQRLETFDLLLDKKGKYKDGDEDVLNMFYELDAVQNNIDKVKAVDYKAASDLLYKMSRPIKKNEDATVYKQRMSEYADQLKSNREYHNDLKWLRISFAKRARKAGLKVGGKAYNKKLRTVMENIK